MSEKCSCPPPTRHGPFRHDSGCPLSITWECCGEQNPGPHDVFCPNRMSRWKEKAGPRDLVLLVADAHGMHPSDWRCLRCGLRGSGYGIGMPCPNCNPEAGVSPPAAPLANYQPVLTHVNTVIKFDWLDRLRILFGRRAHVQVCGEALSPFVVTGSHGWVEPILPRARHVAVTCFGEKK